MTADLGVVFPAAESSAGVERVALEVLRRFSPAYSVEFFGERLEQARCPRVEFRQVVVPVGVPALRPRRFRAAAGRALQSNRPRTLLSFGVNCPPGQVYWVQSVHRAWLESGSSVRLHGVRVPSTARQLLPRHRVLLGLERDYFTRHRPRTVLCTSQREIDDLARLYAVPREVMHVVPNGFDGARFHPDGRRAHRAVMRDRLGLAGSDISLLFVANELHRKGFGVLLDALAQVADDRLRIDVVGRAPLDLYQRQIGRLGLTDRVLSHGATPDVERFYAAADLLVLPTQYEPFGLVIVEALASGLPVITTRLAGAAPAVVRGTGLLQEDPDDAHELASLLAQALEPDVLEQWSAASPAAAAPYEWAAVLARAEPLIFRDG